MALAAYVAESFKMSLVMGAGDAISQLMVEKTKPYDYDYGRTFRFTALGFVYVSPVLRKWVNTLDGLVAKNQSDIKRGFKKMCINQFFFSPPFNMTIAYLVPFMKGVKHDQIKQQLNDQYYIILRNCFVLWSPAQMINFTYVPLKHQVLYTQSVALVWNTYLSWILNKG